ncbi:MAG: alpha/beta fold hydrolase [Limnospira sp. PMC 1291.21]|uniref:Alpha/beta fold hydrolase family protein n=3 Tax=Limnospira TaxID=2596745 RepID=A0A9P1NZS0_9CYAN|nr:MULTISPECIES: alpha/beta fold hydrolase [Limnospira]EKD07868.1 alpha/beta hydrolase fold protein [Arthrospira platensis C1]MDC0836121.1 alpha/beta fold hydrolase [Limnoraphis robusta]MDY7054862.1 alpha/beta fold hydrolase [Limnospira fusiformis LS22]QJB25554.1 alpha/beta fold hydrolase [Limnospira fusiformis SAG 85.79]RAQ40209.1 alpha/beta hydrolase [Arthrospira sp. O9.13F]
MDLPDLHKQMGFQRDWIWRGWRVRYTFLRWQHPKEAKSPIFEVQDPLGSNSPVPLIFLHGFGASIGHWRHNLSVFSHSHPVYALDLLGFGGSEKAIAPYNVSLWTELVHDFWQTFIRRPTIWVGNSIGSLIALATVAQYPKTAKGLVMLSLPDPAAQADLLPGWMVPPVELIQSLVASPIILRPIFYLVRQPSVISRWVKLAYHNPDAVTEELIHILSTPPQERGAARAFTILFRIMGSSKLGPAVRSLFPQVQVPILLLWGKQDRLIPLKLAKPHLYLKYNPHIKLVELEGAGHCPHDECPERVNREIFDWIKSCLGETLTLP